MVHRQKPVRPCLAVQLLGETNLRLRLLPIPNRVRSARYRQVSQIHRGNPQEHCGAVGFSGGRLGRRFRPAEEYGCIGWVLLRLRLQIPKPKGDCFGAAGWSWFVVSRVFRLPQYAKGSLKLKSCRFYADSRQSTLAILLATSIGCCCRWRTQSLRARVCRL